MAETAAPRHHVGPAPEGEATTKSAKADTRPVVVGVDGSPESLAALQWASEYASLTEAPLHAVIAWEHGTGFGFVPLPHSSLQSEARRILDRSVRKALGEAGARVVRIVEEGRPEDVLVRASLASRLLVVGDRGYSGVAGLLLGHSGEACVRHAACSVVVVRGKH